MNIIYYQIGYQIIRIMDDSHVSAESRKSTSFKVPKMKSTSVTQKEYEYVRNENELQIQKQASLSIDTGKRPHARIDAGAAAATSPNPRSKKRVQDKRRDDTPDATAKLIETEQIEKKIRSQNEKKAEAIRVNLRRGPPPTPLTDDQLIQLSSEFTSVHTVLQPRLIKMLQERRDGANQEPLTKSEEELEDQDAYDSHDTDDLFDNLDVDEEEEVDDMTNQICKTGSKLCACCPCIRSASKVGASNEPDKQNDGDGNNEEAGEQVQEVQEQLDNIEKQKKKITQRETVIVTKLLSYNTAKTFVKVHDKIVTKYTQKSLNQFSFESGLRRLAIWINEWSWFENTIIFLIILNSIMLGVIDYNYIESKDNLHLKPFQNIVFEKSEHFFTIMFALELIIKVFAQGLVADKYCYLKDYWNWLDAAVVIGSILSYFPSVTNVSVLRTFRLFRPLRSLSAFPSMRELVTTLLNSLQQLLNVFVLLGASLLIFSIFGLQVWNGVNHYQCRLTPTPENGDWLVAPGDVKICGGFYKCPAPYTCGSLFDPKIRSLLDLTDDQLYRDTNVPELNWGITNFDNILSALLTMFQVITLEGWFKVLTMFTMGYQWLISVLFFFTVIIICHFLFFNLTVAVMITNLQMQKEDEFNELINRKQQLAENTRQRKKDLGMDMAVNETMGILLGPLSLFRSCMTNILAYEPGQEPLHPRYDNPFVRLIWRTCEQPSFSIFYVMLICFNVFLLCYVRYPATQGSFTSYALLMHILINVFFILEIVLKLIAYDFKVYLDNRLNISDFFVTLMFVVAYIADTSISGFFSYDQKDLVWTHRLLMMAGLRALRLILVLRNAHNSLRVLQDCMVYTINQIGNFMVLLGIFIYVFSLLGMQLFAGKLKFDQDHQPIQITDSEVGASILSPRANFDNLTWALLTVFQIFIGEEWNSVFYDCYRATNPATAVFFFVALISFGNIIMMNLFLAMLLGNFEKASLRTQCKVEEEKCARIQPNNQHEELNEEGRDREAIQGYVPHDSGKMVSGMLEVNQGPMAVQKQVSTAAPKSILKGGTKGPDDNLLDNTPSGTEVRARPLGRKGKKKKKSKTEDKSKTKMTYLTDIYSETDKKINTHKQESFDSSADSSYLREKYQYGDNQEKANKHNIGEFYAMERKRTQSEGKISTNKIRGLSPKKFQTQVQPQTSFQIEVVEEPPPPAVEFIDPRANKPKIMPEKTEKSVHFDAGPPKDYSEPMGFNVPYGNTVHLPATRKRKNLIGKDEKPAEEEKPKVVVDKVKYGDYCKQSACLIFHRENVFRQFCLRMAYGGAQEKQFSNVDQLVEYYTQQLPDSKPKKDSPNAFKGIMMSQNMGQNLIDPPVYPTSKDIEESEDSLRNIEQMFEEQLNDSYFLDQDISYEHQDIKQVQASEFFNVQDLKNQAGLIKKIKDSKAYDVWFNPMTQKVKNLRYVLRQDPKTKKGEIIIKWNKWYHLTAHKMFNYSVNIFLILNMVMLALDNPLNDPESPLSRSLKILNIIVCVFFVLEALIKIIALGFMGTSLNSKDSKVKRASYMGNPLNIVDFTLVCLHVYDLFLFDKVSKGESTPSERIIRGFLAIRALRLLQPLRSIKQLKTIKLAMTTVVASCLPIFNAMVISSIVLTVFAIIGLHQFKGTFYRCEIDGDNELARSMDDIVYKSDCLAKGPGHLWVNASSNFDNISNALLTIFEVMMTEGWLRIMYDGIDAKGLDLQPKRNENTWIILYFLMLVMFSHVFMLSMFVGVMYEKFNRMNERQTGYLNASVDQRRWIDIQKMMIRPKLKQKFVPTEDRFRKIFSDVAASKFLDYFILCCIIANTICLSMMYRGMSQNFINNLHILSNVFTVIYNLEAVVKLIGMGTHYFDDSWNNFDFFVVCVSDIGIILSLGFPYINFSNMIVILRALRLMRIFKIIKGFEHIKLIIDTVKIIMQPILSIIVIFILTNYVFAILGMRLFSNLMYQEYYNDLNNFRDFFSAQLLLFRCMTGEHWNKLMRELSLQGSFNGVKCVDASQTYQQIQADGIMGCGSQLAYPFFMVYVVVSQMILLNLFAAFVLDGFSVSTIERLSPIRSEHFESLVDKWSEYDPKATGWIDPQDIAFLVYELKSPLGKSEQYGDILKTIVEQTEEVKDHAARGSLSYQQRYVIKKEINKILPAHVTMQTLKELKLPIYIDSGGHKCHFKDVCISLTKQVLVRTKIHFDENPNNQTRNQHLTDEWIAQYSDLQKNVVMEDYDSGRFWAGLFIARLLKSVSARRQQNQIKSADNISSINERAKYSQMLRKLEIEMDEEEKQEKLEKEAAEEAKKIAKSKPGGGKEENPEGLPAPLEEDEEYYYDEEVGDEELSAKDASQDPDRDGADRKKELVKSNTFSLMGSLKDHGGYGVAEQFKVPIVENNEDDPDAETKKRAQLGLYARIFNQDLKSIFKKRNKPRDFERSSWWVPADKIVDGRESSQNKMKKWIELADIRYGHNQQKQEQAPQTSTSMVGNRLQQSMFKSLGPAKNKTQSVHYANDDQFFGDKDDGEMNTSRPMIESGDLQRQRMDHPVKNNFITQQQLDTDNNFQTDENLMTQDKNGSFIMGPDIRSDLLDDSPIKNFHVDFKEQE